MQQVELGGREESQPERAFVLQFCSGLIIRAEQQNESRKSFPFQPPTNSCSSFCAEFPLQRIKNETFLGKTSLVKFTNTAYPCISSVSNDHISIGIQVRNLHKFTCAENILYHFVFVYRCGTQTLCIWMAQITLATTKNIRRDERLPANLG